MNTGAVVHIHLDPVGGLAGDMFLAAIIDAWPHYKEPIVDAIRGAGLPEGWSVDVVDGESGGVTGTRVEISGDADAHATGSYRDIRKLLRKTVEKTIRDRAIDIFRRLAEVEAGIHGVSIDNVHFHELAGWDSIADIVGAATAIDLLDATWSVGDLPMGSGTVQTAHGPLPVPAPATAQLLKGFKWIDDGFPGERVTPTGAAILAHLDIRRGQRRPDGFLLVSGHGLGTRKTKGLANVLRLIAFGDENTLRRPSTAPLAGEVGVVSFEVDDQTPEDLAVGLDRLRAFRSVLDVVQFTVMGKKGRVAISIRVLCKPERIDQVIDGCFLQTTTTGLRWRFEQRAMLARSEIEVEGYSGTEVMRPNNIPTMKIDMDQLAGAGDDHAARNGLRRWLEEPEG